MYGLREDANATNYSESQKDGEELEIGRETEYKSQFAKLYKARKSPFTQEERRKQHFEHLRLCRTKAVDNMRKLWDVLTEECDQDYMLVEEAEQVIPVLELMDLEVNDSKKRKKKNFRKKLMLSEWLHEKPNDLEENWVIKLCPNGKRNLIVASHKITKVYTKGGAYVNSFRSNLPGGNSFAINNAVFTILDCIYNPQTKCYFVIDVIAWNNISFRQSDVECRYYWLKSKLTEIDGEFQSVSKYNEYPFHVVETFLPYELSDKLQIPYSINGDNNIPLDGILFYRKEVPYVMRTTPLVGWLKPFMVREMFGIDVHESFAEPCDYTTMADYLARLEEINNKS